MLINKADLRDATQLAAFEHEMALTRADEPLPAGGLDFAHYRAIHRHLFQDVYSWAGELRTIRIGKGGSWFCYPEYIEREMTRIFEALAFADHLLGLDRTEFRDMAAHVLADINAVHPFREGNGRTQFSLLVLLAETAGFTVDLADLDHDRFLKAMIASFHGDERPLAESIGSILRK